MEKIPLRILGQARSDSAPEHYIVILEDSRDARRLPIIIGPFEAQAIAIGLEGIDPGRPMTHDLLKNTIAAFQGSLDEVVIDSIDGGVFHAKLECTDAAQQAFTIDARSSDAIAMAVRFGCPIYTYQAVLDEAGIEIERALGRVRGQCIELVLRDVGDLISPVCLQDLVVSPTMRVSPSFVGHADADCVVAGVA